MRSAAIILAAVTVGLAMPRPTHAAVVTLEDVGQNSQIVFDSDAGQMTEWIVEGIEQVFRRQWFYRLGPAAAGNGEDTFNNTDFTVQGPQLVDFNFIPGDEAMSVRYLDSARQFQVTFSYVLTAGAPGSNQATFVETARIDNLALQPLDITMFLYADYDLNDSSFDDALDFGDPRTLTQTDALTRHEASVTVVPTHFSAAFFSDILDSLNDSDSTTLDDNPSVANGDLTYAFQWTRTIAPGASFTLGTTNSLTVVPEASSLALVGLSLAGIAVASRRRAR